MKLGKTLTKSYLIFFLLCCFIYSVVVNRSLYIISYWLRLAEVASVSIQPLIVTIILVFSTVFFYNSFFADYITLGRELKLESDVSLGTRMDMFGCYLMKSA